MRIMYLTDSNPAPTLVPGDVPQPEPHPGELLIRVHAAGVTPTELQWYPTLHTKGGEKREKAVPGHEFSGIVAGIGENVSDFKIGQEIFGMNDWFAEGATAEYCLTLPSFVTLKPPSLTHIEAASVPIGALTAWQGLFDRAKLQPGETVLVHGGAGAVGLFAVQLAKYQGAHVISTASSHNLNFVAGLGAEQVIGYDQSRFEENLSEIDVVFDTVGGETLERSWGVLKPQGRMITIAADGEKTTEKRIKDAFFIVEPNSKQLNEIGNLLESGHLQSVVDSVVPLSQAPDAYMGRVTRHGRGKLVISVTP